MNLIQKVMMVMVAIMVGFSLTAPVVMAEKAEAGTKQCYRYWWEEPGSCSTCSGVCGGAGYYCCDIVVG